jgi:predicted transposase YdaD
MNEYDVALKLILQRLTAVATRELTGVTITRWHNIELPQVQNTRMDLLGETESGKLIHIEIQSSNDAAMALRMLEYSVRVYRLYGAFPKQILLYVGEAPLRMNRTLEGDSLAFSFELVDIRDMDGEPLLESAHVGDNVIAILTKLKDRQGSVRRILAKIAESDWAERDVALRQLLIFAGLRRLEQYISEEVKKMPFTYDIMDNQVIGPAIRKGMEQGLQQGLQQGREDGRQEEVQLVRRLVEKRFGACPNWAAERLANRSPTELEDLAVRLLDARSIEELLQ